MSEKKLVVSLNTDVNLAASGSALLLEMEGDKADQYRNGTFGDVINYALKGKDNLSGTDREIADLTATYISQQNPAQQSFFEITVYDKDGQKKKNAGNNGSSVMHLEDRVAQYVDERAISVEGKEHKYDQLEMVVHLEPAPQ